MIDASNSLIPSRVKTAPWPELKSGLFSRSVTAKVAASRADVEELAKRGKEDGEVRKWCACARIERRLSWKWLYSEGERFEGVMLPAPPWMMMRGVMPVEGFLYSIVGFVLLKF